MTRLGTRTLLHHPDHMPEGERPAAKVRTQKKIVTAYSEFKSQAK